MLEFVQNRSKYCHRVSDSVKTDGRCWKKVQKHAESVETNWKTKLIWWKGIHLFLQKGDAKSYFFTLFSRQFLLKIHFKINKKCYGLALKRKVILRISSTNDIMYAKYQNVGNTVQFTPVYATRKCTQLEDITFNTVLTKNSF